MAAQNDRAGRWIFGRQIPEPRRAVLASGHQPVVGLDPTVVSPAAISIREIEWPRKFFNPIAINLRLGRRKPPSIATKHQQDREAKPVRPALCHHKGVVIRCQRPVMGSTDKQKRKTLTQMAAGDTTVGSRPIRVCRNPHGGPCAPALASGLSESRGGGPNRGEATRVLLEKNRYEP